ncbi:MAG: Acylphosphatase [candidate division WS2 bacterium]|uniref:Acylphosphatase n=1 Tax=Psychracetigena formicireducens TaxID=2986056 RepID=A0A9E2BG16_PSYF1|nr:Acylphosphatase [Candidatus Psychracetigena formicireducens]MBT9144217.1 Acylphosphatase [Candidatus Psychracetigena formicireducens]
MPAKKLIKILVKGRVQGVGFRYFTYRQARQLGLTGYVKNLPSGEVETVAYGEADSLEMFINVIKKGTPFSLIESFTLKDLNPLEFSVNFETFYVI